MYEAKRIRIIVAGGGTGGHLFPGIAVARELMSKGDVSILFVGTDRKINVEALRRYGFSFKTIRAEGIKGRGVVGTVRALAMVPLAILQTLAILRDFRPHLILGVGGYVSGPVTLGGWLMGIKTAIQEQNSIPGLTNRILGRIADRVFISYPESGDYFPGRKAMLTGNPVRKDLLDSVGKNKGVNDRFTVLILGGSQGAHRINEIITAGLAGLNDLKERLYFIHQTGEKDEVWVRDAYRQAGFEATVSAFINDMGWAYGRASVVVCRAGAGTLAELTAIGRPALLIPYPYAANNHQEVNARCLERAGAAKVYLQADLRPDILAGEIKSLYEDQSALKNMAGRSLALGKSNAAALIAEECLKMIGGQ
ncbi:MAG: undecaprenyldiphospho-muramoylpentapeptide beta-N-acetylglucosaminyltransferase [Desulfovibrionales bacterium]|nr:undecaprenyldiphospho-muramoylpentapeptide beta-N-acetylglucosaminyltransferase [Desulfovibrionales bacterium]